MSLNNKLFPLGWWGPELNGYRSCDTTYCWFSYDSLPPLPYENFQGNFNWLTPLEPHLKSEMEQFWPSDEDQALIGENIRKLTTSAVEKNIQLPEPFIAFMSNLEYQKRMPSCTACYFELRDQIMPCPEDKDGLLIRFLNDQQSVFTWYLYLTRDGDQSVVVSRSYLDLLAVGDQEFTKEEYLEAIQDTFVCAFSFEEFIYRFWLENHIWFVLIDKYGALTEIEENYLKHYK
jgi:hypothetical protein